LMWYSRELGPQGVAGILFFICILMFNVCWQCSTVYDLMFNNIWFVSNNAWTFIVLNWKYFFAGLKLFKKSQLLFQENFKVVQLISVFSQCTWVEVQHQEL
jgi:hypothetical protein